MVKRAVLIGIDQYESDSIQDLAGCVGDAESLAAVLSERYEFEQRNLVRLIRPPDTKRNAILDALTKLVDDTEDGDVAVVYYSGHGSQVPDTSGDEKDGWDETIVPSDSHRDGGQVLDIVDDELQSYIAALSQRTAYTTLIFDSCHSGSIDRDLISSGAVRAMRDEDRPVPRATVAARQPLAVPERRFCDTTWAAGDKMSASGLIPEGNYFLLAGCHDDEVSLEMTFDGEAHGLLTKALVDCLRNDVGSSMEAIASRTSVAVEIDAKRMDKRQRPVFEGPSALRDAQPFGASKGRSDAGASHGAGGEAPPAAPAGGAPEPVEPKKDSEDESSSYTREWDVGFAKASALGVIAVVAVVGLAFILLTGGVLSGLDDATKVATTLAVELAFVGLLLGAAGVYLAVLDQRGRSHAVEKVLAAAAVAPKSAQGERGIDIGGDQLKGAFEAVGKMPTARGLIAVGGAIVAGSIALAWHVLPASRADEAPTISRQPASVVVRAGSRAAFAVSADGNDLSYAWRRNGRRLAGSRDSPVLTVGPVGRAQTGSLYTVVVSNDNGEASSKSAKLTVKKKKKKG